MRIILSTILSTLLIFGCSSEEKQQFDLVIKNGKVIDLETGDIKQLNIFISEGKIKKVDNTTAAKSFEAIKNTIFNQTKMNEIVQGYTKYCY